MKCSVWCCEALTRICCTLDNAYLAKTQQIYHQSTATFLRRDLFFTSTASKPTSNIPGTRTMDTMSRCQRHLPVSASASAWAAIFLQVSRSGFHGKLSLPPNCQLPPEPRQSHTLKRSCAIPMHCTNGSVQCPRVVPLYIQWTSYWLRYQWFCQWLNR